MMYSPEVSLTPREKDVFNLICKELNNKEIAKQLGLSCHTVSVHRVHLRHKLNMTTIGIVKYAIKQGIV